MDNFVFFLLNDLSRVIRDSLACSPYLVLMITCLRAKALSAIVESALRVATAPGCPHPLRRNIETKRQRQLRRAPRLNSIYQFAIFRDRGIH